MTHKRISLTVAQYRLLSRISKGLHAPTHRYRFTHATIGALLRKDCLEMEYDPGTDHDVWVITPLGKDVLAAKGEYNPSAPAEDDDDVYVYNAAYQNLVV